MNANLRQQLELWYAEAVAYARAVRAHIAQDHNPGSPENRVQLRDHHERIPRSNRTHGEIRGSVDIVTSQVDWKWKN